MTTVEKKVRNIVPKKMPEVSASKPVIFELLTNDEPNDKQYYLVDNTKLYPKMYDTRGLNLQCKVYDEEGNPHVMRYFSTASTVWQDEQIKIAEFEKNAKHTPKDRDKTRFVDGFLKVTDKVTLEYLWNYDGHILYEGEREDNRKPVYRVFEPALAVRDTAKLATIQGRLMGKIIKLMDAENEYVNADIEKAKSILYQIEGSHITLEDIPAVLYTMFLPIINNVQSPESEVFKLIDSCLEKGEDTIETIVGKAVQAKIVSYDAVPNQISLEDGKKKGSWVSILPLADGITMEEAQRVLYEFLNGEGINYKKTILDRLNKTK